jgi:predicted DNA-binding protein
MKRTTIMLEEEAHLRLKMLAERRATTASHMIREAIESYLASEEGRDRSGPLAALVGLFDGPPEPLSEQVHDIVEQAVVSKFAPAEPDERDRG